MTPPRSTTRLDTNIRASGPADIRPLEGLYHDAFPGERLWPLVVALLAETDGVRSFVALRDDVLAGHVMSTHCRVEGCRSSVALLGPLAVAPAQQRQGHGTALVRAALDAASRQGLARTLVLGDPRYYGSLGFTHETDVTPPYPLVEAWRPAWQSVRHAADSPACHGRLQVPAPWQPAALWSP